MLPQQLSAHDLALLYPGWLFLDAAPVAAAPVADERGPQVPATLPPAVPAPPARATSAPSTPVAPPVPQARPLPAQSVAPNPAQQAGAIEWFAKPQARVTAVLSAQEFSQRNLGQFLKQLLADAGFDAAQVAFGKATGQPELMALKDKPTRLCLVFGRELVRGLVRDAKSSTSNVWVLDNLAQLLDRRDAQLALVERLRSYARHGR